MPHYPRLTYNPDSSSGSNKKLYERGGGGGTVYSHLVFLELIIINGEGGRGEGGGDKGIKYNNLKMVCRGGGLVVGGFFFCFVFFGGGGEENINRSSQIED